MKVRLVQLRCTIPCAGTHIGDGSCPKAQTECTNNFNFTTLGRGGWRCRRGGWRCPRVILRSRTKQAIVLHALKPALVPPEVIAWAQHNILAHLLDSQVRADTVQYV